MEPKRRLTVLLESRTYFISDFLRLDYCALHCEIAQVLEDDEPCFLFMCHGETGWCVVDSDAALSIVFEGRQPILYVHYPGCPVVLRVLSYHLSMFQASVKDDVKVQVLLKTIKGVNPDVLAIQGCKTDRYPGECGVSKRIKAVVNYVNHYRPAGRNFFGELMQGLPEYPYFSSFAVAESTYSQEIIGILSRFPIINEGTLKRDSELRCLFSTISVITQKVQVYNVCCTGMTQEYAKTLVKYMERTSEKGAQVLSGTFTLAPEVLETCEESQSANTYPSWNPKEALDHILYKDVLPPVNCEINGFSASKRDFASSHCSVQCDFILK